MTDIPLETYVLYTRCIYVMPTILKTNSDHFIKGR